VTPRCSFCDRPAAEYGASHVVFVFSRVEQTYIPCCIPCCKRRRDKLVRLMSREELKLRG